MDTEQAITNLQNESAAHVTRSQCSQIRHVVDLKLAEQTANINQYIETVGELAAKVDALETQVTGALSRISDLEDQLENVVLPHETRYYMDKSTADEINSAYGDLEALRKQVVTLIRKAQAIL